MLPARSAAGRRLCTAYRCVTWPRSCRCKGRTMALTQPSLLARGNPLADSSEQRRILTASSCGPFEDRVEKAGLAPLAATGITVFQINVGKLCNQTCRHCHVDAGPDRKEIMSR